MAAWVSFSFQDSAHLSRYVHTHYNFCAKEDIESTIKRAVEVIRGLNDERIRHIMRQDILD